jgi:hypothetical protein
MQKDQHEKLLLLDLIQHIENKTLLMQEIKLPIHLNEDK